MTTQEALKRLSALRNDVEKACEDAKMKPVQDMLSELKKGVIQLENDFQLGKYNAPGFGPSHRMSLVQNTERAVKEPLSLAASIYLNGYDVV